jgi:hypothetical protein
MAVGESVLELGLKPFVSRNGQIGARGMGDHKVPSLVEDIENRTLVMWARDIGREEVARQCIVPELSERVADGPRIFASD